MVSFNNTLKLYTELGYKVSEVAPFRINTGAVSKFVENLPMVEHTTSPFKICAKQAKQNKLQLLLQKSKQKSMLQKHKKMI